MNVIQLRLYSLALLCACMSSFLRGADKSLVQEEKEISAWITKLDAAYQHESKRNKDERITRTLAFEQAVRKRAGARLPGDFEKYELARSASANNILDICAGQQLYINCGLTGIYRVNHGKNNKTGRCITLVELTLKELRALRRNVWATPCTPGGHGEQVKWGLLVDMQGAENFMRNIQKKTDA